ncbi:MAG: HAD-IA family hydrolase [Paracoccaceae bacterium]
MKLIAWDFDGVLNRGYEGSFAQWQQTFEADLGVSAAVFTDHMFASGQFADVLIGKRDLLDLINTWITAHAVPHDGQTILDYWLNKDARLDTDVMDWLDRSPAPGVIATNNESHRADFIWNRLGFANQMQHIFASGRIGFRKPDAAFFAAIEQWSNLPPHEILLIDDADKNIAEARSRGWQTFHFTDETRANLPATLGITP